MNTFKPFQMPDSWFGTEPLFAGGDIQSTEQALAISRQFTDSVEQLTRRNYEAFGIWMDVAIGQMRAFGDVQAAPSVKASAKPAPRKATKAPAKAVAKKVAAKKKAAARKAPAKSKRATSTATKRKTASRKAAKG